MILTKYDLKFTFRLTEKYITVGFVTLGFDCTGRIGSLANARLKFETHV